MKSEKVRTFNYYYIEVTTSSSYGKSTKKYHSQHCAFDNLSDLNIEDSFSDLHKMIQEIIELHDIEKKYFNSKKDDETIYQIIEIEDGKKTYSYPLNRHELESCIRNIKLFKD